MEPEPESEPGISDCSLQQEGKLGEANPSPGEGARFRAEPIAVAGRLENPDIPSPPGRRVTGTPKIKADQDICSHIDPLPPPMTLGDGRGREKCTEGLPA